MRTTVLLGMIILFLYSCQSSNLVLNNLDIMIKRSLCILTLILMLCSCDTSVKEKKGEDIQVINLDMRLDSALKVVEVKYVPLETKEESLFHEMSKVISRNNHFYIFDRKGKSIFVFDGNGLFIKKIHSVGSGPEEYIEPSDIDVDDLGNIYVSDNATQRILIFPESQNGVVSTINVERYFGEFAVADSNFIYLSDVVANGKMNIKLARFNRYNKQLDILEESNLDNTGKLTRFAKHYFYRSNRNIYYYKRFSPYIQHISGAEVTKDIEIQSKWFPTKDKIAQWNAEGMLSMMADMKYIRDISACYETDNTFFIVSQTTPSLYTIIDKKTRNICNTYSFNDKRLDNCIHVLSSDGKYYVSSCLPTSKNITSILSGHTPTDSVSLKRIESLSEDSNPILVLFRFE